MIPRDTYVRAACLRKKLINELFWKRLVFSFGKARVFFAEGLTIPQDSEIAYRPLGGTRRDGERTAPVNSSVLPLCKKDEQRSPNGKTKRFLRTLRPVLLALCLLCLLAPAGCGKKGFPQPNDPSKNFHWNEIEAKIVGNCIAFTGSFAGEYQHMDGIRLEIARLNGPEDCPGCPFVPQEVTELSPKDAGFDVKTGGIAFSYCPQKAAAYRWRLAGISIFNRLPHATMTDRLLVGQAP